MLDSSLEFKKLIRGNSKCETTGKIVFADGKEKELSGDDFMVDSSSFDNSTSASGNFDIGCANIGIFSCLLNNSDGRFNGFDFEGAVFYPSIKKELSETNEVIPKGIYTLEKPNSISNVIQITAYDNMKKFEKPYSNVQTSFPASLQTIVNDICTYCGVQLNTQHFSNYNYVLKHRPSEEMTCIDVISYIAQISGNYAKADVTGGLVLKWYNIDIFKNHPDYDGGTFKTETTPYSDGDKLDGGNFLDYSNANPVDNGAFTDETPYQIYGFSNVSMGTDVIEITGIEVKAVDNDGKEKSVLVGNNTYALTIENNPFIDVSNMNEIAQMIAAKVVGMKFRPFNAASLSDPTIEAGDAVYIVIDEIAYKSYITRNTYKVGSYQTIACEAQTPSKNNSYGRCSSTSVLQKANAQSQRNLSAYDIQMQMLTSLITNSFGVFKSEEVQSDGSTIYYMHNKPERSQSSIIWKMTANAFAVSTDGGKTWNAGIDSSGNAVVNVLSATGINADWINAGTINSLKYVAKGTIKYKASDYSQADIDKAGNIIQGKITPTESDYDKYDISGDGVISFTDLAQINNMIKGVSGDKEISVTFALNPANKSSLITITENGNVTMNIGRSGISLNTISCKNAVISRHFRTPDSDGTELTGVSGTFTTNDGKTVTVTNGIITRLI